MISSKDFQHYQEKIDKIFIHPDSAHSEIALRLKSLFPEKCETYKEEQNKKYKGTLSSEDFNKSKKQILVQKHKGLFFKRCPGGNQNSACCNYYVLNLGSQCHFNCSYCYLQSFINKEYLVIYSNIEDALEELKAIALENPEKEIRVGTGEVIDSLGLDPLTLYTEKLIRLLEDHPQMNLELKTKSDFVDHLPTLKASQRATASWSLNPQEIIEQEEHGTASLESRLDAALKSKEKGYKLSFHIDPVIWHPNWKKNYLNLVEQISLRFSPKDLPYLSLGALRFQPEQRHLMKERFKRDSYVNQAELFKGKDGKLRYDSDLRAFMFKTIIQAFKEKNRAYRVFLCMESPESWLSTYGDYPMKVEGLKDLFSPKGL